MGHNSAAYLHLLIESMKLAYADRSEYLGDPDRTRSPSKHLQVTLTSTGAVPLFKTTWPHLLRSSNQEVLTIMRAQRRPISRSLISLATLSQTPTPSTSALAQALWCLGPACCSTTRWTTLLPSQASPTAMALYKVKQTQLPRKPAALVNDPNLSIQRGKAVGCHGSPGGSRIITAVAQTLLNLMAFDMTLGMATSSPRIHHQWMPDMAMVEPGISADTVNILEASKHKILRSNSTIGRVNSVQIEDGWFYGYADPRRPGGHVATW